MKERAKTARGKMIVDWLKVMERVDPGQGEPPDPIYSKSKYSYDHPASDPAPNYRLSDVPGLCLLGHLESKQKLFDDAFVYVENSLAGTRDVDSRDALVRPADAERAARALSLLALTYDLCYKNWNQGQRDKVARAIRNYDQFCDLTNEHVTLESLARASAINGNSRRNLQISAGAGIALLAILNDRGVGDDAKTSTLLSAAIDGVSKGLTSSMGDTAYPTDHIASDVHGELETVIPFVIMLNRLNKIHDFGWDADKVTNKLKSLLLRMLLASVKVGNDRIAFARHFPDPAESITDATNQFNFRHPRVTGLFAESFALDTYDPAFKKALLWGSREFTQQLDATQPSTRFADQAIYTLNNWPIDLDALPADQIDQQLPLAILDQNFGHAVFRNTWTPSQNKPVFVTSVVFSAPDREGLNRIVICTDKVIPLGTFTSREIGKINHFDLNKRAVAWSIISANDDTVRIAVDYSGMADVLAVITVGGANLAPADTIKSAFIGTGLSCNITDLSTTNGVVRVFTFKLGNGAPEARILSPETQIAQSSGEVKIGTAPDGSYRIVLPSGREPMRFRYEKGTVNSVREADQFESGKGISPK